MGVCPPGAVGDGAKDCKSAGGSLHCFADMIPEGESAVEVDSQVSCGGGGGVLGDNPLDCESNIVGHGLRGGVKDADVGLVGGEGQLPDGKPGRDVVKNGLNIPQLRFSSGGGAAGDRGVDGRIVSKLRSWESAGMEMVRSLT